jgi:hypothetical protein
VQQLPVVLAQTAGVNSGHVADPVALIFDPKKKMVKH